AGVKLRNASIVQKVTIIPRGSAGGYAMMLPEEETMLSSKQELLDRIIGLLAGRVAEELTFGEITTGASHDFQEATRIARAMVTEFGMSKLGPIQFEQRGGDVFLGRDYTSAPSRNFSDQLALKIDEAVAEIINDCYAVATSTLTEHTELMKLIAETLLVEETLTKEQIDELVEKGRLDETDYGKGSTLSEAEKEEIKAKTHMGSGYSDGRIGGLDLGTRIDGSRE
ncbi:MAG: zinc metalloprotease, partial [Defluviitaleaceae bacterium]|nr:zinc metalloprotease [Defluviitaleaceae bacterium]